MKNFKVTLIMTLIGWSLGNAALADDRTSTTPTQNWVSLNGSEADIQAIADNGYRMHDVEVISTNPYRFVGNFVRNSGSYGHAWWWTADKSFDQLKAFGQARNARPIDIEVNVVNGARRFAGTFIKNTGSDYTPYWVFDNVTYGDLQSLIAQSHGRMVDVEVSEVGNELRYTGILIRNQGAFYKNWIWFANRTSDQMQAIVNNSGMRFTDVERHGSSRFSGILESGSGLQWYRTRRTQAQLEFDINQFGARVADIERRVIDGQVRYDYILTNNSNALETRIGQLLRNGTDGTRGFYLRQLGEGTLGALMEDFRFYPASTIKVLEHFYYSRRVDNGLASGTLIPIYTDHLNDTHPNDNSTVTTNRSLTTTLQRMMLNSNNQDTNALQDYAGGGNGVTGRQVINSFKTGTLGIGDDMKLNHKLGGLGASNDPANVATLRAYGSLYEQAADGSVLSAAGTTFFRQNMLNETTNQGFDAGLDSIITQEGSLLGMTNARRAQFRALMLNCWKPGNWAGTQYVASAGWVQLPWITNGRVGSRQYVVGAFAHDTTTFTFSNFDGQVLAEILREQIRSALQTFL